MKRCFYHYAMFILVQSSVVWEIIVFTLSLQIGISILPFLNMTYPLAGEFCGCVGEVLRIIRILVISILTNHTHILVYWGPSFWYIYPTSISTLFTKTGLFTLRRIGGKPLVFSASTFERRSIHTGDFWGHFGP